mmetsp:Transcript_2643/g.7884  ORF Transcript_2643/g.7884 Transcript_2643/m.7884 type:complete len:234 (-) Transcript_2643:1690-2391(-)
MVASGPARSRRIAAQTRSRVALSPVPTVVAPPASAPALASPAPVAGIDAAGGGGSGSGIDTRVGGGGCCSICVAAPGGCRAALLRRPSSPPLASGRFWPANAAPAAKEHDTPPPGNASRPPPAEVAIPLPTIIADCIAAVVEAVLREPGGGGRDTWCAAPFSSARRTRSCISPSMIRVAVGPPVAPESALAAGTWLVADAHLASRSEAAAEGNPGGNKGACEAEICCEASPCA